MFRLCDMKQLNFGHFDASSKKFSVTVNSFQNHTKNNPKRPSLFRSVYQGIFDHFLTPTISKYFRTLRKILKTTEDVRRLIQPVRAQAKSSGVNLLPIF